MTTTPDTPTELVPTPQMLGANKVTLVGDRTTITFYPQTPGPLRPERAGGELSYDGPEGSVVVYGADIARLDSPLGFQLTVLLRPDNDTGQSDITVLLPRVIGVTMDNPVVFSAVAIKTTRRGFVAHPGASVSYDLLPLLATAEEVMLPL